MIKTLQKVGIDRALSPRCAFRKCKATEVGGAGKDSWVGKVLIPLMLMVSDIVVVAQ